MSLTRARIALLTSILLFVLAVLLLKLVPAVVGFAFWLGIAAIAGIVFSATACLTLLIVAALRNQASPNV